MVKEKISDEMLDLLYNKPLDLYKWKCAMPGCRRFTKVWKLHGIDMEFFAWLRVKAMNWISNKYHFWLCAKHFQLYKKRKFNQEGLQRPSEIALLKKNVMKRKRYSLIEKLKD